MDDEVRHRDEATEGLDLLAARRMLDVDENVVGRMDRAFVYEHRVPAGRLAGQEGVDADFPQYGAVRPQAGGERVGVASYDCPGEGEKLEGSAAADHLARAPEIERDVLQSRVAEDQAPEPRQQDILRGGNPQAARGALP